KDIQTDYARALKEAEVMFKSAANQQNTAEAELKRAQEIRNRAASTSNIQERQSLIKQAEVLELSAKAKLKESQNMEAAGLDLALNAKTKKGELETFIANLNPSLSTMILAYNNKQITDSTSPTLANVQPQQAENQNENSNIDNSKIINNNTTTPQTSNTINPNINAFFTQTTDASPNVIYNPENKSIFKIGEANTAFYNEAQPIQFNPKLPNGLVYKVQIGAFNNRINPGTFRGFAPITAENTTSGLFRYSAGLFELYQVADAAKNEIRKLGYADAFV